MNIFDPAVVEEMVKAGVQSQLDRMNENNAAWWRDTTEAWTLNATQARNNGRPMPAKPEPPKVWKLIVESQYVWHEQAGPETLFPIPDLPTAAALNDDIVIKLGVRMGRTNYYGAASGDSAPEGHVVTLPEGTFVKRMTPFGGYWEKTA